MNNATILIKVKNRLNKLASNDYTNLDSWIIVEAFNKAQVQWCRRNLHGTNIKQEGADQSISRIDDLQQLLTRVSNLTTTDQGLYYETVVSDWPAGFLRYERIALTVTKDCCPEPKSITVYLGEEANVDLYLQDINKAPNYEWGHTFAIVFGNKLQVYHNNQFIKEDLSFIYYRQPRRIQIVGVRDLNTNTNPTVDVECEFSDDLVELLVDEAASILAADIESWGQNQRLNNAVENNN